MRIEIPDDVYRKLEQGLFKRAEARGEDPGTVAVPDEMVAIFTKALEELEREVGPIEVIP